MVVSINSNTVSGSQVSNVTASESKSLTKSPVTTENFAAGRQTDTSSLSSLSLQLSESAARAAERDSSLSRKELGAKASELLSKISGDGYFANKKANDAEVPNTQDPALLARAENATQFVNGSGKNPFAGMSSDQLSLIIYDESGSFTTNERRAAWKESFDQESAWRQKVVANSIAEYNETGKLTKFFTAALEHYKDLPAIEQAQYPDSYETKLQGWIALDFNYKTHTAEGTGSAQDVMDKVLNLDKQTFNDNGEDSA
ncbi:hypothetical protein V2L05_14555 [Pseudomonas alliivorans]|uniref:hypothetical protein n=1 Tax=Pseudomonas TaxID=286 RepID=UPI000C0A757F|nr:MULTISPECIES: hypothetical protein [Pseudomonas]MEE4635392.1 hypothetical protein [Pseudomonas alliivorans]MEE4670443.1 hypothetical protein [Pseudomonas alliivorans]MEE4741593.1 hypothetical protein [Pseudomonas alliivorans]MEE4790060.1 hypothetical protein [Pseudomonas alliivorans]MEE4795930.1 hypothetical protein [Pseudomonas alliivorans]